MGKKAKKLQAHIRRLSNYFINSTIVVHPDGRNSHRLQNKNINGTKRLRTCRPRTKPTHLTQSASKRKSECKTKPSTKVRRRQKRRQPRTPRRVRTGPLTQSHTKPQGLKQGDPPPLQMETPPHTGPNSEDSAIQTRKMKLTNQVKLSHEDSLRATGGQAVYEPPYRKHRPNSTSEPEPNVLLSLDQGSQWDSPTENTHETSPYPAASDLPPPEPSPNVVPPLEHSSQKDPPAEHIHDKIKTLLARATSLATTDNSDAHASNRAPCYKRRDQTPGGAPVTHHVMLRNSSMLHRLVE